MKLPDGPKIPPWLQLIQCIANPVSYMEAARERYGDIFIGVMDINAQPSVIVSNPQALKQILTDTKEFTAPGELNKIFAPIVGDYGVSRLDGNRHRQRRKLLMPPFHGERMQVYGQLICDLTEKAIGQLTPGQRFSARAVMQEISGVIISDGQARSR